MELSSSNINKSSYIFFKKMLFLYFGKWSFLYFRKEHSELEKKLL